MNLYSRTIFGCSVNQSMTQHLVCDALTMALFRRGYPKGGIVYSDRGSQYCSKRYQRLIKVQRLLCSMSRKGCCYDNAAMESFLHSLKVELIHRESYPIEISPDRAFLCILRFPAIASSVIQRLAIRYQI
jgi:putative transposase